MIYKQIEDADKVFGRSLKLSSGSFNEGFQLSSMHIDEHELSSPMTNYVQTNSQNVENNVLVGMGHDELTEAGHVSTPNYSNYSSKFLMNEYLPQPDATRNYQEGHWTEVRYGDYYANIYDQETQIGSVENEASQIQFSITYGNKNGYGSRIGNKSASVTQAIYNQYKNILLGPGDEMFTFTSDNASLSGVDLSLIHI